jgi:lincosamide nucleotidyltransferase A/C/D/E
MPCTGQEVIGIIRLLEECGVPAWLDGGWAIDALLGRETRGHEDVDLILPFDDLDAAELAMGNAGFARNDCRTNLPNRLVLWNCNGLQIDIRPVTFKPNGSAVHIHAEAGGSLKTIYVYSSAGLSAVGKIDGRIVRCVSGAELVRQKVERQYSPWAETRVRETGISIDLEDIRSLLEVFGIAEGRPGEPVMVLPAQPADNPVIDAAGQPCLRHVSELNAQHSRLIAQHAELSGTHSALAVQHARLKKENAELMAQIDALRASTSWQLTAPMRWTRRRLDMHRLKLRIQ